MKKIKIEAYIRSPEILEIPDDYTNEEIQDLVDDIVKGELLDYGWEEIEE